jgi:hypothetical protein
LTIELNDSFHGALNNWSKVLDMMNKLLSEEKLELTEQENANDRRDILSKTTNIFLVACEKTASKGEFKQF